MMCASPKMEDVMVANGGRLADRQICVKLFVRHGDEDRAIAFYREALGASSCSGTNGRAAF